MWSVRTSTFLELVEDKTLPAAVRIRGMPIRDRLELDAAFDNLKAKPNEDDPGENTVHRLLGIGKYAKRGDRKT